MTIWIVAQSSTAMAFMKECYEIAHLADGCIVGLLIGVINVPHELLPVQEARLYRQFRDSCLDYSFLDYNWIVGKHDWLHCYISMA